MEPLVSVMVPCYNAAGTLPMALASLLAQSYSSWEAIVVDDGSQDDPAQIVAAAADPRLRLIRFATNRGRGAARQAALEAARGDLLCKLDADDWLYPGKLARQVAAIQYYPAAGLVTSGIAVVDAAQQLVGVRAQAPPDGPLLLPPRRRFGPVTLAHAPSMVRMPLAKATGYDCGLRRAEDADFLLRLLRQTTACVLPEITYVYTELAEPARRSVTQAYRAWLQLCWRYRRTDAVRSTAAAAAALAKWGLYAAAFSVGGGVWLLRRRSHPPTAAEAAAYAAALCKVQTVCARRFGPARYAPAAVREGAS